MTKDNITSLDSGLVERLYNMVRPLWRYAKPGTPDAAMFDRSERGIMLRKSVEAIAAVQASDRTAQGREMVLEEALEPFARVARIQGPLSKDWPDDKPNIEFIPSAWPDWADFKRASEALKDQSNDRTPNPPADLIERLEQALARVQEYDRPLPWVVHSGCSYRRIASEPTIENGYRSFRDGNVLHGIVQRSDGHPDLSMGEDQLNDLVAIINAVPDIIAALKSQDQSNG